MKPTGPIPPDFAPGRLQLGGQDFHELSAAATPIFIYDFAIIADRVARLRAAFPAVDIHYAVKANPHPPLLRALAPLVDGLDVASAGELEQALKVKTASTISFAGPGKSNHELSFAINAGATLNLESEGEAERALQIADHVRFMGDEPDFAPRLAVRVNPDFELKGSGMRMGGRASPFGIDAARVPALVKRLIAAGADWQGFHIFAGSQALDTDAIIAAQAATLALAKRLADEVGTAPSLVNLGGGFGIPYFAGDTPIDEARIGASLADAMTSLSIPGARYALELGRWLVGESGVYLTRVIDRKESRGQTFLICDGGLHHQLAATGNFGTVVRRNYPLALADRIGAQPTETVNVVGPLCTPLDRLGDQVSLPRAEPGDVIAVFLAGAYGLTSSPTEFLGHRRAAQFVAGTHP